MKKESWNITKLPGSANMRKWRIDAIFKKLKKKKDKTYIIES